MCPLRNLISKLIRMSYSMQFSFNVSYVCLIFNLHIFEIYIENPYLMEAHLISSLHNIELIKGRLNR